MADVDNVKFSFSRLNNDNYQNWKFRTKMLLIKEGLWSVVEDELPEQPMTHEWKQKDGRARATISLSIDDNQIVHVYKCRWAKEMWTELQKVHERSNLSNKLYLLRKLYQSKLENKTMSDYIKEVLELVERLSGVGEVIKDFHVAALLLGGLPDNYASLVTALDTRPDNELTLEYVKGKLIDEFKRKGANGDGESALNVRKIIDGVNKVRECYFCHRKGHYKKDCFEYKKVLKKKNGQAKVATQVKPGLVDGFCFGAVNKKYDDHEMLWVIDSGASSHMSNNKRYFTSFSQVSGRNIIAANGQYMEVKGKGDIKLEAVQSGSSIMLKDVLFVPDLDSNLLAVSKITVAGYQVEFDDNGKCHIRNKNGSVITANLKNGLYAIDMRHEKVNLVKSCKQVNCIHVWHRRLGHRNPEGIKQIVSKGLATGIEIENCHSIKQCITCIEGKLTRKTFPKVSEHRSSKLMEIVHSDLCGPMRTSTVSGMKYFLTFTDDFSRYTKVYLVHSKDEVPLKLKEYMTEMWNTFKCYPKIFRSDNGTEYTGNQVQSFLKDKGISFQSTVPYSPEQNGVSERKNRTLMESARCMLLDAGLPHKYWGEAVMTANYIINRLPTSSNESTPYELWTGNKPNLNEFVVFGSPCYTLLPKGRISKLEKRTTKGIMVGYSEISKGYRILDPKTDRISISRTVRFDEFSRECFRQMNCYENKENEITVNLGETEEQEVDKSMDEDQINEVASNDVDVHESSETSESLESENSDMFENAESEVEADVVSPKTVTRSGRILKKRHYEDYVTYKATSESDKESINEKLSDPVTVSEAMERGDWPKWHEAMKKEYNSLMNNEVWVLVDPPVNKKLVKNKWVFNVKRTHTGETKYKARLVAKGFTQEFGIDYLETFSPVVRYSTIRILFAIAVEFNLNIDHLDVETAFLHGELDQEIYMSQPEGFIDKTDAGKVCLLKKAMYGLKQASRVWNISVKNVLDKAGLMQSNFEPCIYYKIFNVECILIVALYVDDFLVFSNSDQMKSSIIEALSSHFKIKNLGQVRQFLGMNIIYDKVKNTISIDQKHYILELLKKFGLLESKSIATPMEKGLKLIPNKGSMPNLPYQQLIGSLMYLTVHTRPDISFSVNYMSQFNKSFGTEHYNHAKRILRYLKYSINKCLVFTKTKFSVTGFVDADFSNNISDRKSFTGYVFMSNGGAVSWEARKQNCVALSSTEAEYIAISEASKEAVFIKGFLSEILKRNESVLLYNDSQSAQKLIKNPVYHNRTKHIDTRYHFIREVMSEGTIIVKYLSTNDMVADIFTKSLVKQKHEFCTTRLGLKSK